MFISSRIGLSHAMGGNERPWLVLGGWRPRQGERREGREAPGGQGRDGVHTLAWGRRGWCRRAEERGCWRVREAEAVKEGVAEGAARTGTRGLPQEVDWEGQVRPPS